MASLSLLIDSLFPDARSGWINSTAQFCSTPEFFASEKKLIEESHKEMEKMLSQHREKLKRIKDGESVWLSFKAWVWAIIIFEISLLLVSTILYYIAKAKFT